MWLMVESLSRGTRSSTLNHLLQQSAGHDKLLFLQAHSALPLMGGAVRRQRRYVDRLLDHAALAAGDCGYYRRSRDTRQAGIGFHHLRLLDASSGVAHKRKPFGSPAAVVGVCG